jgi:alkanesulfonate monooxygenase SsuD/methylene tetrahydromethanopterin reductase-like flavin-dependent oxidoreductase (luciferase family)
MVLAALRCQIPMTESLAGRGRQGSTVTSLVTRSVRDFALRARQRRGWYGEAEGVTNLELFSLGAVAPGSAPAHRIGIWLGASGPRMLNLLGRRADGWIAPLATGFETKPAAQERIDRAAIGAGREPSDVRRVIQLVGAVTDRPETQQRPVRGPGNQPLRTTAEIWAEIIAEFVVDERFDTVNLIPQHETSEQIAMFGQHVIPLARDAANARGADA